MAALLSRSDEDGTTELPPSATVRQLVPYLREHRRPLAAVVVLSLVSAAAALAQPVLVSQVIEGVQDGETITSDVVVLLGVLVAGALLGGVQLYLLQRTAEGVVLSTRRTLADRLLRLPVAEYDRRRTGDLMSRVGSDTTMLQAVVTSGLFEVASSLLVVVGAVVAMLLVDPLLLLVTLASVAVGIGVVVAVSRRVRVLSLLSQVKVGEMTAAVERALSAVRTIRASGATEREVTGVVDSARAAYDAGIRSARLEAFVSPATSIAVQGSFVAVLGLGGYRVASGAIGVSDLVAFILYLFLLLMPLGQMVQAWTQLQAGLGALSRIEEVVALPGEDEPTRATVVRPRGTPEPAVTPPMLELDAVDFSYSDALPVLRGVSFSVPRGTRTALVGPSGAGKSTVLALVERFYDVTGGAVRVDGTDVRDLPRADLRARMGYVEQEAPVLAGTIGDNLTLAAPGASEAAQRAVLAAVRLDGVVDRTPEGLDAQVGDGGVLLSGGERQRLAIARSLLARPGLLLLDEPTANLDARNERALRLALDAVSQDRTLLVVAHRLSTVVDSDQIVVLDAGRVVATGTHEELVETNPLYRELAASQLLV